jgi:hypothetical protein
MRREAEAAGGAAWHLAAGLTLATGLLHFQVAPHHFEEAFVFGLFMVAVGAAQVAAGLLLLARPSRALLSGLWLGTVLLLGLYAAAHTIGVPLGPHPWQPEHVHPVDLVSKGAELALLPVLAWLFGARQWVKGYPLRSLVPSPSPLSGRGQG